jgi:hypothetical protein
MRTGLLMLILVASFAVLLVTIDDLLAGERTVRDSDSLLVAAKDSTRRRSQLTGSA